MKSQIFSEQIENYLRFETQIREKFLFFLKIKKSINLFHTEPKNLR